MSRVVITKGDLIQRALAGEFDAITHSCNCFCRMKRGIAPQLAKAFGCNKFNLESTGWEGDINKLGVIDFADVNGVTVINSYMQFHWKFPSRFGIPFDYDACRLCLRKINYFCSGKRVGMPWIGCGLAGGNKDTVLEIIEQELKSCLTTIVEYE